MHYPTTGPVGNLPIGAVIVWRNGFNPAASVPWQVVMLFMVYLRTLLVSHTIEQRCPPFLYIGARLSDGCGGAGAVWRLQ
jgi:hypothetical protein